MKLLLPSCFALYFLSASFAAPTPDDRISLLPTLEKRQDGRSSQRTVVYWQTEKGDPSLLVGVATNLIVAAIHINADDIHINDTPYNESKIWEQLEPLKEQGLTITGLVGGAAPGSFKNLNDDFDKHYALLKQFFEDTKLQGIDIDIEEQVELGTIVKLVTSLKRDFGKHFIISFAPVPSDLLSDSYQQLERQLGDDIDWYNTQFYCGHGEFDVDSYLQIIEGGVFPPNKVVAGVLTNPKNCESGGFVDPREIANSTIPQLLQRTNGSFGGVAAWEYFNSLPGGENHPEQWAQIVSKAMNPISTNKNTSSSRNSSNSNSQNVDKNATSGAGGSNSGSSGKKSGSSRIISSQSASIATTITLLLILQSFAGFL